MFRDIKYIIKRIIIGVGIALCLMFIKGNVYAALNNAPFDNLTLPTSANANFFDISGNNYTSRGYSFLNYNGIYYALPSTPNFTYGNYGASLNICELGLVTNNYYTMTYVFVSSDNNDYINPRYSNVTSHLGIGNSVSSVSNYFNYTSVSQGWDIQYLPGILPIGDYIETFTIVFKPDGVANCLNTSFSSYSHTLSATELAFVGYTIENNGSVPLSSSQIETIINNSNQQVINNITNSTASINANSNANRQAIIDNANANNQALIESNEQNTQDIIDNNNENWNNCENYNYSGHSLFNDLGYLNSRGEVQVNPNLPDIYYTSRYIPLNKNVTYILTVPNQAYYNYCLYDSNKNLVSCTNYYNSQTFNINLNYEGYIRYTIDGNTTFTGEYCFNRIDETNNQLNDLNNSINDDNVDSNDPLINDLLNDQAFQDNTGLSSVINAPLSLLNNLTGACQPINLNLPYFNTQFEIPCMSTAVYSKFPLSFITTIKTIINGFLVYRIIVMLYFLVKDLKDPESDRVEVVDL